MGAVVRSEREINEAWKTMIEDAEDDDWTAAWAEALEWVLS
jgi:hypothetical protein